MSENICITPADKSLLEIFVNYMSKVHSEKWSALVGVSREVEERLRDAFHKTWCGPIEAYVCNLDESGAFTSTGRFMAAQMMSKLSMRITVDLLPSAYFYDNPPRPEFNVCIKYGTYIVNHMYTNEEFNNSSVEAIRQRLLGLEQHLKLRIGA